jgi:hypothetical protein
MSFCLDCHRNPEQYLRDPKDVYNLDYEASAAVQQRDGNKFVHDWNVLPSQGCSACHR